MSLKQAKCEGRAGTLLLAFVKTIKISQKDGRKVWAIVMDVK
jgi:hypothetical protein